VVVLWEVNITCADCVHFMLIRMKFNYVHAELCRAVLYRRVFHPTPPFATLLGFHLLIFSHTRLETVDDRYGYGTFFSPNCSTSSLRCTCLIFQFLWPGFLCHRSPLENAHHCASQPCKEQQWRNKSLSSCL
jgi:hypothetical protein